MLLYSPIENWNEVIYNDFEPSIFSQFPEIETIKSNLYEQGALYASMTGTGSTVFGIFDKEINLTSFPESYFIAVCNL